MEYVTGSASPPGDLYGPARCDAATSVNWTLRLSRFSVTDGLFWEKQSGTYFGKLDLDAAHERGPTA